MEFKIAALKDASWHFHAVPDHMHLSRAQSEVCFMASDYAMGIGAKYAKWQGSLDAKMAENAHQDVSTICTKQWLWSLPPFIFPGLMLL